MELVSGCILWMLDVLGVKAIRSEGNIYKKVIKMLALFILGFVGIVLYFITFGAV